MSYGLLFDYEYCTNCGSCQVTCKEEHGYPVGKSGIQVHVDGPWKIDDENWNFNNWPIVTDLCDLCADRTAKGREPMCVHHCLANVITYGTVEELAKKLDAKPKQFLVVPQFMPARRRASSCPRTPLRTRRPTSRLRERARLPMPCIATTPRSAR